MYICIHVYIQIHPWIRMELSVHTCFHSTHVSAYIISDLGYGAKVAVPSKTMGGSLERFSPVFKAGQQSTTEKNTFETDATL